MKIKLILLFGILLGLQRLAAQGTSFTYQGRLNDGGTPATGLYDFQFTVRDAPTSGSGVGVFPLSFTLPVAKSFIVSATAGQILRLQFTANSTTNRPLANNGLGTVRPSISMTVIRIQ